MPHRAEGLKSENTGGYIRLVLSELLGEVGVGQSQRPAVLGAITSSAHLTDHEYERIVYRCLERVMPHRRLVDALSRRAWQIFQQVSPFLKPGRSLDLGCGDARLSEFIRRAAGAVVLADVYPHEHVHRTGLPFVMVPQEGHLPFRSGAFENVVLCTVLHHSERPLETLREAVRVTRRGGRLLIHESVYSITQDSRTRAWNHITNAFSEFTAREQLAVNTFFDHFYNRCLFYSPDVHLKVSVPYNFQSPPRWVETLKQAGLSIRHTEHLGVDLRAAPLFHTLFVAEKV